MPVDARDARLTALELLRGRFPDFEPGEVWLTGAGPGDPGLLTLDALAALLQADIVVHDALIDERVLSLARTDARRICVGKRGGRPSTAQAEITQTLIALAKAQHRVLRLKGGDPFIFGRGGEEASALAQAGIHYRIIPGITSGLAALTAAGIPATMRGINQAIVLTTGHAPAANARDWSLFAQTGAPIVFYMGLNNLDAIRSALLEGGLHASTPAAIISAANSPAQRVMTSILSELTHAATTSGIQGPAIVVVGEIVRVRHDLLSLAKTMFEAQSPDSITNAEAACAR
jgi:uroporphyrin-III C-methyltransferase